MISVFLRAENKPQLFFTTVTFNVTFSESCFGSHFVHVNPLINCKIRSINYSAVSLQAHYSCLTQYKKNSGLFILQKYYF